MKQLSVLKIIFSFIAASFLFLCFNPAHALVNVIAAENVYGNIAQELGGPYVNVTSILNSPSSDPHLFSTRPSTARAINNADIIIYNGADYDPWITPLLAIAGSQKRTIINIASLLNIKPGANPHLWYLPETMPTFAKFFVATLSQMDPLHQSYYQNQLKKFNAQYQIIFKMITQLKKHFQNIAIIATEPIFGYMAKSIGLQMHAEAFQINMMNDVPPTVSQIQQFTDDLQQHQVKVLIYNNQVINPLTQHLRDLAVAENIPVVGISEMMPNKLTYIQWMQDQLQALEIALEKGTNK